MPKEEENARAIGQMQTQIEQLTIVLEALFEIILAPPDRRARLVARHRARVAAGLFSDLANGIEERQGEDGDDNG